MSGLEDEDDAFLESDRAFLDAALQAPNDGGSIRSTTLLSGDLPRNPSKRVTLHDVLEEHPREDVAETTILAETEEDEGPSNPPPILRMPPGAEEAFDSFESGRRSTKLLQDQSIHSIRNKKKPDGANHKRQPTMEERIDGLTDVLEAIHGGTESSSVAANNETPIPQKTSVDTMNLHAHLLKKRPTAKQRWNKLQTVVVATGGNVPSDRISSVTTSMHGAASIHTTLHDVEAGLEGNAAADDDDKTSPYLPADWHRKSQPDPPNRCEQCLSNVPILTEFLKFCRQNAKRVRTYIYVILFIMLPSVAVAAILFYWADNYPTGRVDADLSTTSFTMNHRGKIINPDQDASISWWILFIGCRQLVTFSIAQAWQFLLIDFCTIGRRWFKGWPVVTLLIVQSRGWPFLLASWSVISLGLNYGNTPFAANWLFWQSSIGLFNDRNPSGGIHSNTTYLRILCLGAAVGVVVSAKRTWIGFFLAKKTYVAYASELTTLMKQIILLSRVAQLAKEIEEDYMEAQYDSRITHHSRAVALRSAHQEIAALVSSASYNQDHESDNINDWDSSVTGEITDSPFVIDPARKNKLTGALTEEQKLHVTRLLGAWEEPDRQVKVDESLVSINAVLRFRQSLTFLETPYVFTSQFGLVDTRQRCIESAQEVYMRLFLDSPESPYLNFDVIATLARRSDDSFNIEFLKDLIALLRPGRDGTITLIEFVKSVDAVYKQARLLSASIKNSHKIDVAFEFIFNFLFYVTLFSIVLSILGFSPFQIFLSLSSIILAFAFMIGSASSKYFEGLLFILVQKPYDIGDRINIEPANSAGQSSGSASWVVKDVSLFTTTIVLGATNEKATVSNGTLASSRIINAARSPNAVIIDFIKFGLDVPYSKIKVFHEALNQFVKARPREWLSLIGFRASEVAIDQGFVKYIIILQHRSSWQELGAVKQSHADVQSYCLELTKEMDMRFQMPVVPVNLSMVDQHKPDNQSIETAEQLTMDSPALQRVASLFEQRR